ncbi:methylenetetrahydrofolate--tRNA-(uracil(54)-C(5))-methyltransferase (FADH(2)-oxidizing) TrmFO [Deferribacteraceae bacterium V6Fe1]|nr:methylenetetrahydrofolate--tRNA-(uracil(54)-C(5))-methyltransferase (FADH(2)-oxidizing) TrmFO [Deferribacteraceae bacterium V6Fe1]
MKSFQNPDVVIVGGGLAGSEAALFLASKSFRVRLYEMRPHKNTEAHETDLLGELVCSNSLKSESLDTANGLLKAELLRLNSPLINIALNTRVPSGGALSVDRNLFAQSVTEAITNNENIELIREELSEIDFGIPTIIATGPLTSSKMTNFLTKLFGDGLFFYDAISPIIDAESINYDKCFFKSRYDKGEADYLNCPMTKEEFQTFYNELINADKVEFKDFERGAVFERCMPIEEMASRGEKTLTFGPMRPVGLRHPETNEEYYAVVQLRKENNEGTAYNIVGFQTKMKIGEQKRVFRLIPGLENAEFLRFGSIHRNTYVKSPGKLNHNYKYKELPNLYIAGQLSGVEGYVESIASGLTAALDLFLSFSRQQELNFPKTSALRSLGEYVSTESKGDFSPSNFHFGMLPPLDKRVKDKKLKKVLMSNRSLEDLDIYIKSINL